MQRDIMTELCVSSAFDAKQEIERRTTFIADYLIAAGQRALVLGISGGVDSLVGGMLSQRAVAVARQVRDQDVDLAGPVPALPITAGISTGGCGHTAAAVSMR